MHATHRAGRGAGRARRCIASSRRAVGVWGNVDASTGRVACTVVCDGLTRRAQSNTGAMDHAFALQIAPIATQHPHGTVRVHAIRERVREVTCFVRLLAWVDSPVFRVGLTPLGDGVVGLRSTDRTGGQASCPCYRRCAHRRHACRVDEAVCFAAPGRCYGCLPFDSCRFCQRRSCA